MFYKIPLNEILSTPLMICDQLPLKSSMRSPRNWRPCWCFPTPSFLTHFFLLTHFFFLHTQWASGKKLGPNKKGLIMVTSKLVVHRHQHHPPPTQVQFGPTNRRRGQNKKWKSGWFFFIYLFFFSRFFFFCFIIWFAFAISALRFSLFFFERMSIVHGR